MTWHDQSVPRRLVTRSWLVGVSVAVTLVALMSALEALGGSAKAVSPTGPASSSTPPTLDAASGSGSASTALWVVLGAVVLAGLAAYLLTRKRRGRYTGIE